MCSELKTGSPQDSLFYPPPKAENMNEKRGMLQAQPAGGLLRSRRISFIIEEEGGEINTENQ